MKILRMERNISERVIKFVRGRNLGKQYFKGQKKVINNKYAIEKNWYKKMRFWGKKNGF